MREFTVLALTRPTEIAWHDEGAVRAAVCMERVEALSADHARAVFTLAFMRRSGLGLNDVAVIAIFSGRLTEGGSADPEQNDTPQEAARPDAEALLGSAHTIVTVKQFLKRHACFTHGGLRTMLFDRETNGLAEAVIQCGRKILIDEAKFFAWLESQQGQTGRRSPQPTPLSAKGRGKGDRP